MRYLLGILLFVASLGAVAVTMIINATYQYGQGASPSEATLRAIAMAVFDCVKAGLPVGMIGWWVSRQWALWGLGAITFVFCFLMSLISAIGFYATNHSTVSQGREGLTTQYRKARRELDETEKRIGEIGTIRPAEVMETALNALRTDKRYLTSKSCEEATLPASREFCRDYFAAEGELALAHDVQRLQGRRGALLATIERLMKAGAERDSDPQATMLNWLLPFLRLQDVKFGADLLPSMLLELVAGFGLMLATGMMQRTESADGKSPETNRTPNPDANALASVGKPMTFKVRKDGTYVIDSD